MLDPTEVALARGTRKFMKKSIRRWSLILAIAGLPSVVPVLQGGLAEAQAAPPVALTADQIAVKVQDFYDKSKTFRAKFEQRYYVEAYKKTKHSNGMVVFEKPGKMSWRYQNNGNRVVSDGKLLRVYEQENNQVYEQSLEKSQYPGALSFLLGGGSLKKEFNFETVDPKSVGYEGGFVLLGKPKAETPAYQKILLYIDAGTFQVRRVLMIDAQRNRNRFDFIDPVVNKPVDKQEFQFTMPKGAQVIKP
jgi:outer membrane lipoprotein carrier protein